MRVLLYLASCQIIDGRIGAKAPPSTHNPSGERSSRHMYCRTASSTVSPAVTLRKMRRNKLHVHTSFSKCTNPSISQVETTGTSVKRKQKKNSDLLYKFHNNS